MLSQPFAVVKVLLYVPGVFTVVPLGNVYPFPLQIVTARLALIVSTINVVVIMLSQPVNETNVSWYIPGIFVIPPLGNV